MTAHIAASRPALFSLMLVAAVAADAAGSPQARRPPAPKSPDRDAMLDKVKESVALVKGKYGHGSGF
ncbi:MAG TPA: hypothetical protein VMZ71_12415, partial [Gemmataceae bacterium]|nr:hypothetical protein [Gemmataceae bacterium]